MYSVVARLAERRFRLVIGITAAWFILATFVGGGVISLLNADNDSFSDTSSESADTSRALEAATGIASSADVVVVLDTDRPAAISAVKSTLENDDGVAMVVGGPDAGPPFLSDDGSQTYLAVFLDTDFDANQVTKRLNEELGDIDGVTLGGLTTAFQQVNNQVEHDLIRAELLAFPLLFLVALWVFRSGVAALLPLLVGGLTIVTSLTIVRGINEALPISIFALNLITGLGLGLAIDYSLFLVSRFREELAKGAAVNQAVRTTVATAGRTVVFSAVTVAGAGVALLVFPLRFLYSMGIGVIIVALIAGLVSLLVLPAIFTALGHRVNAWAPKRWQRATEREARAEADGFWYRLSWFVMRHPIAIALSVTMGLLAVGAPFLGVKFTGVDAGVLPESASARIVDDTLKNDFTDAAPSAMVIAVDAPVTQEGAVAEYAEQVRSIDGIAAVSSPVFLGNDTWRIDVHTVSEALSVETLSLVKDVRALDSPGAALVGGPSAEQVDQVAAILDAIPFGLAILATLTVIALFLMTGSLILPLKAIAMNILTVSATFGILVMIFQWGHLEGLLGYTSQGALESTQPVFLFAVVFGLSTDYAVFLLTRIKEARDGGANDHEAVALGLQRTGRIVTAAALLFAIALGAFATSEIIFIKQLGLGVALAVLIDATIVRALLVPSLMALLGRANWWAPKPLRRLHDRIGLREG